MKTRTLAALSLVAVVAAAPCVAGLRWNASPSMPIGVWQFVLLQGDLGRGQVVGLCLPAEWARLALSRAYTDGGGCQEGHEPLLKPIAAVPGDVVDVSPDGVRVNGVLTVPPALPEDAAGRPLTAMPQGRYLVQPGSVWVLSDHNPRSLDSRYFGPVPVSGLIAAARPVLVGR
ncbi:conjugative transfer signal peptidase TraF [Dankookia rubra]|uniref:Signal peptidase I n=1 Tax=Dankookia rubra TaxID=1442381 RepID=A0A4R5QEX3_9PROT|nr:conjugative transfer signal peptidase TraF [Dankookia rubra]TDH61238.1 conjugative transfer signal peptidase TraF [Dankookia rubra]